MIILYLFECGFESTHYCPQIYIHYYLCDTEKFIVRDRYTNFPKKTTHIYLCMYTYKHIYIHTVLICIFVCLWAISHDRYIYRYIEYIFLLVFQSEDKRK